MLQPSRVRVNVFLGAGASCAADFPTVRQFFNAACPQGQLVDQMCSELARRIAIDEGNQDNKTWPDFDAEKVFGWLELIEKSDRIRNQQTEISNSRIKIPASDLLSRLKQAIVQIYGRVPDPQGLATAPHSALLQVLNSVTAEDEPLYIFTTNYDTLFEQLLANCNGLQPGKVPAGKLRVCDGFSADRPGQWRPELFGSKPKGGERLVHLVKLHGSVTWKRNGKDIVETGWRMPTEHDCLLYFGYKSIPEEEPFVTLHGQLKAVLLRCEVLIAIGFRFADPYIRELVDLSLRANPQLQIICSLTREPEPDWPLSRMMKEFSPRVRLLVDALGKPVFFGHTSFAEALSQALDRTGV